MTWKRRIGWAAMVFAIVLAVVCIGGYFYLKSSSFQKFALRKIADATDAATGGRTSIGGMDFSLSTLTADLYDITMRGTERPGDPPLLHADKLTVRIKIVSALHRHVSLRELLIEHPVAHIQVRQNGENNLPQAPPSQSGSHTNVFDLAVGHAHLANGEIDYNDRKIPLAADLYDLDTDIRFSTLAKRYDGLLSYRNGRVKYENYTPLPHNLQLRFAATPQEFTLESATFNLGSSDVKLHATVSNYSNPVADGNYQIRIHTQDFGQLAPSVKTTGDVILNGKLHYQTGGDQPFLRNVLVDGDLGSEALVAVASSHRLELRKLEATYRLAEGNLQVRNLRVETFGGRIMANASLNHLDSMPDSQVQASLQGISLRQLQQALGTQQLPAAALSGTIGGTASASWKGTIGNLKAQSDLILQAKATNPSNPGAPEVPVNGAIHASYDASRNTVALRDTVLRIPSATLTAQGTLGNRSSLQVQLLASDLHQLEQLASSFASKGTAPALSGTATVSGLVQGSLKNPMVTAHLNASNLQIEGSSWSGVRLELSANPSRLSVQNGLLTNARRGQASFSATVQLHNWSYQPSDPIQAELNAQQLRITDLLELAHEHYPISGDVSARLSVSGSQMNPVGSGQVEITNANAYGEPISRLTTNLTAKGGVVTTHLNITTKAGDVNSDLSYTPKSNAYRVNLKAPEIVLQKLESLQARNAQIAGTISASVDGEGTLDDPQLAATVQIPKLQAQGHSIGEIEAVAHVAQHHLDLDLDSKVSQVPLHAQARVELAGNFETTANVDTGKVPLAALIAAYAPSVPSDFQGETELHASLKGPLKDASQLEAHVSIPTFKVNYQSLQLAIASPIRADYSNSVVVLQPADLEGTGTSLHVQGRIPVRGTSAPTLSANGSVDLRILKIVAPSVQSSGSLALNLHSTGSAAQPQVQGQLQLKDIAVATPDAPIGVAKLNGTLDISNNRIQVQGVTGQLGGGQLTLGGSVSYRPTLQFNLAAQAKSVRLLYPDGLRSQLDANLALAGTTAASTLTGRVLIDSLSFTPDFDLSTFSDQFATGGTVSQPGFADTIKLAIAVASRENLNATSSQVSIAGQAALQVGGTAGNPVITGRTTLNSGELFYRNVRYQLQRGFITFDDPNQTHPVLNVSVTTTVEQYNLTLTLRGPMDNLRTSYVSDPPLATADIINLIARGKTTQESAANSQSTDSMLASGAASTLSSQVQKLAGISSLEIDPTIGGNNANPSARVALQQRVTKNLLFTFSTDVSQPGSEIVQGEYQLNNRWSVSVERDQLGGVSVGGRYHKSF